MIEPEGNDIAKRLTDGIKANPGKALVGGLALGVLAAALLPRGSARRLAKGAVAAATVGTEAGMVLARQARERAQAAEESAGAGLRRLGRGAAHVAGSTRSSGLDLAHAAIRLLGSLRR